MVDEDIFDSTPFKSVEELAEDFRGQLETICMGPSTSRNNVLLKMELVEKYIKDNNITDFDSLTIEEKAMVSENIDRILKSNIIKIK
jgi:hypothetical protein